MSTSHLRNPLDFTDLIIPLNSTKTRYLLASIKDLKYPPMSAKDLKYPLTSIKNLKYPLNPKN